MVVWEKSAFCPKHNHQGPWEAQKYSWCAFGKSQWKASSSFPRCWKGPEVDGLETSFCSQCSQMLLKFTRDQVWLMLSIYLFWSSMVLFFHLKQVNGQECVISTNWASSSPSIPDLWMKSGRRTAPHHNIRLPGLDASVSSCLPNNQSPWGKINRRLGMMCAFVPKGPH